MTLPAIGHPRRFLFAALLVMPACAPTIQYAEMPPPGQQQAYAPDYAPPPEAPRVDYVPPDDQPAPVAIEYAPPPLIVEAPPPMPFADAIWVGGFWAWQSEWVWATGRWMAPPMPGWGWTDPYYENRGGVVIFVGGYWRRPGAVFVPPPPGIYIAPSPLRVGAWVPPRPVGPSGVFVPPPPGSRPGLIVPAPIGTHPSVLVSAPPIVRPGMVVRSAPGTFTAAGHPAVVVSAPPGVTHDGRALNLTAPAVGHIAAAQPIHPAAAAVLRAPVVRPAGGQMYVAPTYREPVRPMAPVYTPHVEPVRPAPPVMAPRFEPVRPAAPAVVVPPPAKPRPVFVPPPPRPAPVIRRR